MNLLEDVFRTSASRVHTWDADFMQQTRKLFEKEGTVLRSEAHLDYYFAEFGSVQQAKLTRAFAWLDDFLKFPKIRIIDYGGSYSLAPLVYHDFLNQRGIQQQIEQIILIQPSIFALRRANELCCQFYPEARIEVRAKDLPGLSASLFNCDQDLPTLHLFLDILEQNSFEMSPFIVVMRGVLEKCGYNQFVCVSSFPSERNTVHKRIDLFHKRLEGVTSFHSENLESSEKNGPKNKFLSLRTFVIETEVHQQERISREQRNQEKEGGLAKWKRRLEECTTIGNYDLFIRVCPDSYPKLLQKARWKRTFLEHTQNELLEKRRHWEDQLGFCIQIEDYERFIETCPKAYYDLLVEANKKRKTMELQLIPNRPLLDCKEYWERELHACNTLSDYTHYLKKCPTKYSEYVRTARLKIEEIELLGKEEKLGCGKWLFLAIILILLPLVLKLLFF